LRIAYLPGQFPMLSETPVLNQITGLVKRGHEVDVFGDRPPPGLSYHPSVDEYHLLDRAFYRPDLPRGSLARWAAAISLIRASKRPEDRKALLRSMNLLRFGTRAAKGRLALQTAQFLPPRSYDIIQGGFGEQGLKAWRMKRVGAMHGRLVTAFRGADLTRFLKRRGASVYRPLFRHGDLFMPVSRTFAQRLIALGCPPEKIVVHRTGIDCARFTFEPRAPGSELKLITVGRLVEKKGIEDALTAIRFLRENGMNVSYTIVGDGPLRGHLEEVIQRHRMDRVRLTGALLQAVLQEEVKAADILLAPSVTAADGDEEGIPNVLKEAMATGRPVVTTRHSGIPELVEDGVTGFLADEHDPRGLARAVTHLWTHREIWPGLLQAARGRIEREYDIERLNDLLVEHYRTLIGTTSSPARSPSSGAGGPGTQQPE
jgi:colanic acid/amylovoran biosynthesis glycosyltransferase